MLAGHAEGVNQIGLGREEILGSRRDPFDVIPDRRPPLDKIAGQQRQEGRIAVQPREAASLQLRDVGGPRVGTEVVPAEENLTARQVVSPERRIRNDRTMSRPPKYPHHTPCPTRAIAGIATRWPTGAPRHGGVTGKIRPMPLIRWCALSATRTSDRAMREVCACTSALEESAAISSQRSPSRKARNTG
jgi:hypothetical protein